MATSSNLTVCFSSGPNYLDPLRQGLKLGLGVTTVLTITALKQTSDPEAIEGVKQDKRKCLFQHEGTGEESNYKLYARVIASLYPPSFDIL